MNEAFAQMAGNWSGTMLLILSWLPQREFPSASRLAITPLAQDRFLQLAYDWSHEGPQEGVLLFGHDAPNNVVTAGWVDTWHQGARVMACKGSRHPTGVYTMVGAYEVESSPDWHWRIDITAVSANELRVEMYNISPDGKPELAVRAEYRRVADGTATEDQSPPAARRS